MRRPLIVLLTANYLSWFGNAVTVVAVPLYVLQETGSSLQTGLAGFANTLPLVFAGAAGGVLVDRFGGRRVGVLSDLAAGVCMVLVPLLHGTVGLPMPVLLALLFGRSLAATPAGTARLSQLAPLAEAAGVRRETANTVHHSAQRLALVLGPPLAAALVAVTGPAPTLYLDAGSFLLASLLTFLGVPATERPATPRAGFARQLRDGFAFVAATPVIGAILAVLVVTNFVDDAFAPVLLPVYATEVAGDVRALGWLLAAGGVGAVIGTLAYAPASRNVLRNRYATFIGCFAAVALLRVLMVYLPGVPAMAALTFLVGLAGGPLNPLLATVMQERVPEGLQGRVFGLTGAVAFASVPLGVLSAGWSVELVGLRYSLLGFAVVYLALVVVALRLKSLRELDEGARL
ncbi:MFS transporter [Saccharothrix obliqua]|uniref:MFS transporter n=1 Tax=Saccharothrix obliqua TaxID=2861747 RepID=UPI001C5F4D32|nr:MFS transporter [Saccharothrix obliqua]MBW4718328.1 MFS transporter [Saccharothrix obliqua]